MTISEPFIPPLGLKPRPTQPVVLTTSLNVMFPWWLSKPQLRHTRWFLSRYSIKGRSVGSDVFALSAQTNMKRRGSRETMMRPWSCRHSNWAGSPGYVPSHLPSTHLHCWMGWGDDCKICTLIQNTPKIQRPPSSIAPVPIIFHKFYPLWI